MQTSEPPKNMPSFDPSSLDNFIEFKSQDEIWNPEKT